MKNYILDITSKFNINNFNSLKVIEGNLSLKEMGGIFLFHI
jgi:hypothetical protein